MKKKIVAILFIVGVLVVGTLLFIQQRQKAEEIEQAQQKLIAGELQVVKEEQAVTELRLEGGFLKEDVTEDEMKQIKDNLKETKGKLKEIIQPQVEEEIEKLSKRIEMSQKKIASIADQLLVQSEINALFTEDVINGNKQLEKPVIRKGLTEKNMDEITLPKDGSLVKWTEEMHKLQQEAKRQIQTFQTIKEDIDKLAKKSMITTEELNEQSILIENVLNDEMRTELEESIKDLNSKVQDIKNLSEGEIARRALAILLVEYYESDETDTDYMESIFRFTNDGKGSGGIQYLHRTPGMIDGKPIAGYRVEKNGDIEFYNDIGGSLGIGKEVYGNLFDVDEKVLSQIRLDVSDLAPEIWDEIDRELEEYEEMAGY